MKGYEKPSAEIISFKVEDIMDGIIDGGWSGIEEGVGDL